NRAGYADVYEAHWIRGGEIPGLFRVQSPSVQGGARNQRSAAYTQGSGEPKEISDQKSKSRPPSRNILVETFRIYFRGFFQFFCLSLLSIVPIVCAELTSRFIDTAPGVNVDLRSLVAVAFGLCMLVLRLVLIPIY